MNAHPMLQPTDWSRSPESIAEAIPEKRRRLYKVIWDCALACTLVPPILRHTRFIYGDSEMLLAIACVEADSERIGYWRFRQDYPKWGFPVMTTCLPSENGLRVESVWAEQPITTLGYLLGAMEEKGIGTAASVAKLIEDLVSKNKGEPLLTLDEQTEGSACSVVLTRNGKKQLEKWQKNGLTGQYAEMRMTVDMVANGKMGYRDALEKLAKDDPNLLQEASDYLDTTCGRWAGLGRGEGLASLKHAEAPHHAG
ncbi:MAG TPA: hypothetical protein PLG04_03005 [Anaerolineaceae bacterium]|jgi:DNA topoisomerase IA|nr:hypothetical protein [Syntrophorhabdaceae bacterium]HOR77760.1 hypothetical protein [Anaerolineaceae bacterium]HPL48877.1 hypothetical protein [Smithella sp.]